MARYSRLSSKKRPRRPKGPHSAPLQPGIVDPRLAQGKRMSY